MFRRFVDATAGEPPAPTARLMGPAAASPAPALPTARPAHGSEWLELKTMLHQRLLGILNLAAIDKVPVSDLRREVGTMVGEILAEEKVALNAQEFAQITEEVLDEVLGLGPLEPLLKDPTVTDILVNTHQNVFVERRGKLELTPVRFKDERHLLRIIDKIVSGVGRRVDESQPWVDARLTDGSRVNAIVPPCALDGALLSIRKFAKIPLTIDRLIENGALTRKMAELLAGIVKARLNLIISGGTGSGKTTMLNAASSFISERERILTIEDAAELQLQQFHVARLETRPPNIEGKGAVTQRDLVRNALRMRPDRIILGEIRGAEALDMLQAMNTGHDGSMTTIHANNCREALGRLEQMLLMTGLDFPMRLIRAQIAAAVDVIVQVERLSDGKRRLVSMHEITGMEGEVVTMQEIFRFRRTGVDAQGNVLGQFEATGIRPRFAERLATHGIKLPNEMFETNRLLG
jgi:pilus assembly protein CpaF